MTLSESVKAAGGRGSSRKEETDRTVPPRSRCKCTKSSVRPWLINRQQLVADKSSKGCTMFSPFAPSIKPKRIPELWRKTVVASQYGWLIVVDTEDTASMSLFNPFSLATIDLPRLDILSEELKWRDLGVELIMTCVPNNDNIDNGRCVVVAAYKSVIMICRPGHDRVWCMHAAQMEIEGVPRVLDIGSMAMCNGVLHGILNTYLESYLVKFIIYTQDDSDGSHLRFRLEYTGHLNRKDSKSQSPDCLARLVESRQELYYVLVFLGDSNVDIIDEVRVQKFVDKDVSADVMVVETLENRSFFVGYNSCSSCYVSDQLPQSERMLLVEENCVYITDTMGINYVYRLQDRTLALVPSNPIWLQERTLALALSNPGPRVRGFWVIMPTSKKRYLDECSSCSCSRAKSGEDVIITEEARIKEVCDPMLVEKLPMDLIAKVPMGLGVSDYSNFRATCKIFRDLAPPLSRWPKRSAKIEHLKKHHLLPWLINLKEHRICNVTDPFRTNHRYLMTTTWDPSSCVNMDVACSKDGVLLMIGKGHMFFYNPFNKVMTPSITPDNLLNGHNRCIGYSVVPSTHSSDRCTIAALHYSDNILLVGSYVYGDQSWLILRADRHHPGRPFYPANNSPLYYKNAFYFLDMVGNLARLTVSEDFRGHWRVPCDAPMPLMSHGQTRLLSYLLECDGAMWGVFACFLGRWVRVFRLDYAKMRWCEDYNNLDKYMIFLSPRSSFAVLAPTNRPDLGNKLYFSRLGGHCRDQLLCYDLSSRTYCLPTASNVALSTDNFYQTKELLGCTWIQPAWSS